MARRIYQISRNGKLLKSIDVEFESPINPGEMLNPTGVFYNGKNLWYIASRPTESWVFLLTMNGDKIKTTNFSAVDLQPSAIIDIGRYLLISGDQNNLVCQFDYNLNLIKTIDIAGSAYDGGLLGYDGKSVLISGDVPTKIAYIDFLGKILKTIPISAIDASPGGTMFDGAYVWFFGNDTVKIYKITGGGIKATGIDLSTYLTYANSMSFNGKDFYIATGGGVV